MQSSFTGETRRLSLHRNYVSSGKSRENIGPVIIKPALNETRDEEFAWRYT